MWNTAPQLQGQLPAHLPTPVLEPHLRRAVAHGDPWWGVQGDPWQGPDERRGGGGQDKIQVPECSGEDDHDGLKAKGYLRKIEGSPASPSQNKP